MPHEKTDPRTGMIIKIGLLAIVTLIGVRAALVAYFDRLVQEQVQLKAGNIAPEALMSLRQNEKDRLTSGPVAIDKAMAKIAEKGRMNASPDIVPQQSRDIAPLQGWTKLPSEVPPPMMAVPSAPPTDTTVPPAVADAGAAMAADAATRQNPQKNDAGAPKPAGSAGHP
jgi:hypothetical protein